MIGIFPIYAEEVPQSERKPVVSIPCDLCNETGEVDAGFSDRRTRGEFCRKLRLRTGLSLREFCHKFELNITDYANFERGKEVSTEDAWKFMSIYGRDLREVIGAAICSSTEPVKEVPHKCPVCDGCGMVHMGFYEGISSVESPLTETCRTCNGKGVIWR